MNQIVLGAIINNIAGFTGCIMAYIIIQCFERCKRVKNYEEII